MLPFGAGRDGAARLACHGHDTAAHVTGDAPPRSGTRNGRVGGRAVPRLLRQLLAQSRQLGRVTVGSRNCHNGVKSPRWKLAVDEARNRDTGHLEQLVELARQVREESNIGRVRVQHGSAERDCHRAGRKIQPVRTWQLGPGAQALRRGRARREDVLEISQGDGRLSRRWRPLRIAREVLDRHRLSLGCFDRGPDLGDLLLRGALPVLVGCRHRDILDRVLDLIQHRLGRTDNVLEPVDVFADTAVDLLLDGPLIEVVGYIDPPLAADTVETADALFDAHEVPRHVVVDELRRTSAGSDLRSGRRCRGGS